MFRRWVVTAIIMAYAGSAFAGAWVEPKGEGLFIGQATYYSTNSFFDTSGQKQPQPRYRKYELQPYAEYGATEWLTIGGSAYLQAVSQSGDDNYGIADPQVFARARMWHDDKQVVSLQPLIKFGSGFADSAPPRGGSESVDAELSALYGRNMHIISGNDYLDTRIGYRARSNDLSNEVLLYAAIGLSLTDDIQLVPAIRAIVATDLKNAPVFSQSSDLDSDAVKAEIAGLYHLNDKQWLQASFFKDVAGVQTGNGYGVSIGFAQKF